MVGCWVAGAPCARGGSSRRCAWPTTPQCEASRPLQWHRRGHADVAPPDSRRAPASPCHSYAASRLHSHARSHARGLPPRPRLARPDVSAPAQSTPAQLQEGPASGFPATPPPLHPALPAAARSSGAARNWCRSEATSMAEERADEKPTTREAGETAAALDKVRTAAHGSCAWQHGSVAWRLAHGNTAASLGALRLPLVLARAPQGSPDEDASQPSMLAPRAACR